MRIRIPILCLFVALLAAAPVVWSIPANAVIHGHGDNRGPGGGDDRGGDDDDDGDDDEDRRAAAAGAADVATPGAPAPTAVAGPGPAAVAIVDGGFQPASVSVAAGSPVTWTNSDSSRHTATADGGAFDSGSLDAGGTFSFTFPSPGTFAYFCAFHSDMQASVTVTGPASTASSTTTPITAPADTTTSTSATAARADAAVAVQDYDFSPARLTVGRGAEVTWRNSGEAPHTVTGKGFDSGELITGQRFAHRFDTPGTYDYRCDLHPRMQGVIEVVADATAAPVAEDLGGFPLERVAAGGIVGAPILLFVGAVFLWGRR